MTALIQNISVPAGNDVAVEIKVDVDLDALGGSIVWRVYDQTFGIPGFENDELAEVVPIPPLPLIEKTSESGITVGSPGDAFTVQIDSTDTIDMLRTFFHEATLVDAQNKIQTLSYGLLTVTETTNYGGQR